MRTRFTLLIAMIITACICLSVLPVLAGQKVETEDQQEARMKWWKEARFGMFIHWGIYSVPAGVWQGNQIGGIGEWIMNTAKIPVADYARFAEQFNPVKFNPYEWVRIAKAAGMKYIVITSKHHDGFAMFRSSASSYNVYDATPFKRDVIKELAAACRKYHMPLGFYYSQAQDWHHPGGAAYNGRWDPAQEGDINEYVSRIAAPQVRELLTNYGKISIFWWDTPWDMSQESVNELVSLLDLQPGIITNDRLGNGVQGDFTTPEQYVPGEGMGARAWETCMTVNDTWGFKTHDTNWKSAQTLVRNLIDAASRGGNFLLNVGPTAEGTFPQPIVERLMEMGKWLRVNGEAIYGTSASPLPPLPWGRCTAKGSKLYLSVYDWPADDVLKVPLADDVKRAYLLAKRGQPLKVTRTQTGLEVQLPSTAPDPIATVIVLER